MPTQISDSDEDWRREKRGVVSLRMKLGQLLMSHLIAVLLRLLALTWRIRLDDRLGLTRRGEPHPPLIWVLWHNRLIIVPILYERMLRHRKGVALISRSKDGALLAHCIERFGGVPVRGSSSRGGSVALAELRQRMRDGYDVYITPDGPRGPRYSVAPGVLWLAQSTGAELLPLHAEFSRCWRLRSWDGFAIPKPFARVTITFGQFHSVRSATDVDGLEQERERLRETMMAGTAMK